MSDEKVALFRAFRGPKTRKTPPAMAWPTRASSKTLTTRARGSLPARGGQGGYQSGHVELTPALRSTSRPGSGGGAGRRAIVSAARGSPRSRPRKSASRRIARQVIHAWGRCARNCARHGSSCSASTDCSLPGLVVTSLHGVEGASGPSGSVHSPRPRRLTAGVAPPPGGVHPGGVLRPSATRRAFR